MVFHSALRGEYDAVVAMYHDQGLAPLKTVAFDSGINWTLGLPFIRTSPDHGTAYNIAGQGIANPLATILSVAMMLRYTFNQENAALRIENAVKKVLAQGLRTGDIFEPGTTKVGTKQMGDAVLAAL